MDEKKIQSQPVVKADGGLWVIWFEVMSLKEADKFKTLRDTLAKFTETYPEQVKYVTVEELFNVLTEI